MAAHVQPPKSHTELMAIVAEKRASLLKKASENGTPSDPTNKGTTAIPKDSEANNPSQTGAPNSNALPASGGPSDSLVLQGTNPSPSGAGSVPATTDGNAIDDKGTDALKRSSDFVANLKATVQQAKVAAGAAPAAAPAAATAAAPAAPTAQSGDALKQATDLFAQIGALVCADEAGRQMVTDLVTKQAGINQAQAMIHEAAIATDIFAKQAALDHAMREEEAQQKAAYDKYFNSLPEAKRAELTKLAALLAADAPLFTQPWDEFYWTKGAGAAMAAMQGAPPEGAPPGPEGMPPEGGEMGPMPGGDGVPTPEDAQEILQALVQQGVITPEQAEQLMAQLAQELGGAEGSPPGEGGAPPTETPPSEEEKVASAFLAASTASAA